MLRLGSVSSHSATSRMPARRKMELYAELLCFIEEFLVAEKVQAPVSQGLSQNGPHIARSRREARRRKLGPI
jgi:hypothetical protein